MSNLKSLAIAKTLKSLFICMTCMIIIMSATPMSINAEDFAITSDSIFGYSNLKVELPEDGGTYKLDLAIGRKDFNGNPISIPAEEVYKVTIQDSTGAIVSSGNYDFKVGQNSVTYTPELQLTLEGLQAGYDVIVQNIVCAKDELDPWGSPYWDNYNDTKVRVAITDEVDQLNKIQINEENPAPLIKDETTTLTSGSSVVTTTRETEDTFTSLGGKYSILYILNNYNVLSFDDIESTHIVGPIIAKDLARRTTKTPNVDEYDGSETDLIAADYTKGILSYVGNLTSVGANKDHSALQLNYIFDREQFADFVPPYFYTNVEGTFIEPNYSTGEAIDWITLADRSTFISPNDSGKQLTYQNDNFFNFAALESAIIKDSQNILQNGSVTTTVPESKRYVFDGTKVTLNGEEVVDGVNLTEKYTYISGGGLFTLKINTGESWEITGTNTSTGSLAQVDITLPDDYDYYTNPYLFETCVNFTGETINPTEIDGKMHSQFPQTLINGAEVPVRQGENGEFGEVGNKIVWNMPNLVTDGENNRLVTMATSANIAGHLIAPQAEFWNYEQRTDGSLVWEGGNLNGAAIFKSFHSGETEMHMWPYDGAAEEAVVYGVNALKTFNGKAPKDEFTFELSPLNGEIPDGVLNHVFPMYAESNIDPDNGPIGFVKFSSLAFNKAGNYSFVIKETIPTDASSDNIKYDLTQYQIDIEVTADTTDPEVTVYKIASVRKYKIVDSEGNTLETPEFIEDLPDVTEFKFDNKTTTEGTVNVTFTKVSEAGNKLSGAKFTITEMTSATDTAVPDGGYFANITSDKDGKVHIDGLEKGKYYKIVEHEAPTGHIRPKGYWILEIGPEGFLLSITPMDGAEEITDNTIVNQLEANSVVNVPLYKKNQIGQFLPDVNFLVQRVVIENGIPEVVVNGFSESYTTDENGYLLISNLHANQTYMVTETSTPDNHVKFEGYWLIEVEGNTHHPSNPLTYTIKEYDKDNNLVGEIADHVLINERIEHNLPTTGGIGTQGFVVAGLLLMTVSIIAYKKRKLFF